VKIQAFVRTERDHSNQCLTVLCRYRVKVRIYLWVGHCPELYDLNDYKRRLRHRILNTLRPRGVTDIELVDDEFLYALAELKHGA
jgi:hypothetical protein